MAGQRYHVLAAHDGESIEWNGHVWNPDYQAQVVETVERGPRFADAQQRLSCGHWTDLSARFCPHCGRAIVVRL